MPECLFPVAKLQFPRVAGILNLCVCCGRTLETWTKLCGSDSLLGSIASGFFSEQCETVTDWKAEWKVCSFCAVLIVLCSVVHCLGFVRSSLPSLPTVWNTTAATTFLLLEVLWVHDVPFTIPTCGMYSYCFVGILILSRCRANLGPGIKACF